MHLYNNIDHLVLILEAVLVLVSVVVSNIRAVSEVTMVSLHKLILF